MGTLDCRVLAQAIEHRAEADLAASNIGCASILVATADEILYKKHFFQRGNSLGWVVGQEYLSLGIHDQAHYGGGDHAPGGEGTFVLRRYGGSILSGLFIHEDLASRR